MEDQLEIRTNYNSLNLSLLSLNDTDLKTQTITAEFFVNDEKQTANFEFISGNEAVFTVTDEGEVSSEGIGEAELTVKAVAGVYLWKVASRNGRQDDARRSSIFFPKTILLSCLRKII